MTTDTLDRTLTASPQDIRRALLVGSEIAIIDVREEHDFAQGHPLFAAQIPLRLIDAEARWRIPRFDTPIVVYDAGEGLARKAAIRLAALGYTDVRELDGGWPPGGTPVTNCLKTSTATPRHLVNWSSIVATRLHWQPKRCRL